MDLETAKPTSGDFRLVTVGLDTETTDKVRQAALQAQFGDVTVLPEYSETALGGQVLRTLKEAAALVCLIDFDKDRELAVQTSADLQTLANSHKTLVALSVEVRPEAILHAMRAGCTEYLNQPLRIETLAELLRKLRERWRAAIQRSALSMGKVLAFLGVRGGAGATTIAVHLASFLARRQAQRTLIVDRHPCLGHVALLFGMDGHSYNFYELLQNISRLDLTLLDSYVAHHSSGADILPSLDHLGGEVKIEADVLGRALRFVAGVYDYVLIDCPRGLDELNLVTAATCDELYLVATPEVPAVRDLARYLDRLLELELTPSKLKVLINQYGSNRPVTQAQIEKAIRHPVALSLPSDAASLVQALATGQPISIDQKSEFGNQIKIWAAKLAPATAKPTETKRRFAFWS